MSRQSIENSKALEFYKNEWLNLRSIIFNLAETVSLLENRVMELRQEIHDLKETK